MKVTKWNIVISLMEWLSFDKNFTKTVTDDWTFFILPWGQKDEKQKSVCFRILGIQIGVKDCFLNDEDEDKKGV